MNTIVELLTKPGGLADQLKDLRKRAGLTGMTFADKTGWSQPKVSKLETGRQTPTEDDIRVWARTVGADVATTEQLLQVLRDVQSVHREWRHQVRLGQANIQRNYDEVARNASVIRNFELVFIPGLLQTADYARARIEEGVRLHGADPDEVDTATLARMRRQEVLYDPSKRFEFVLGESALRYLLCPPAVMRMQLDRLADLIGRPNVTLGVIPFGVELPLAPQNTFVLFDDLAAVETIADEDFLTGDDAVKYSQAMDRLLDEAVTGEEARRLILAAADALS